MYPVRPTVGVSPGTFTLALNGTCPPDPTGTYMISPWSDGRPMDNPPGQAIPGPMIVPTADGRFQVYSPWANEVGLMGLRAPKTVFGVRLDILAPVLVGIVGVGLIVGALASK